MARSKRCGSVWSQELWCCYGHWNNTSWFYDVFIFPNSFIVEFQIITSIESYHIWKLDLASFPYFPTIYGYTIHYWKRWIQITTPQPSFLVYGLVLVQVALSPKSKKFCPRIFIFWFQAYQNPLGHAGRFAIPQGPLSPEGSLRVGRVSTCWAKRPTSNRTSIAQENLN